MMLVRVLVPQRVDREHHARRDGSICDNPACARKSNGGAHGWKSDGCSGTRIRVQRGGGLESTSDTDIEVCAWA